jgi:uncharacterized protein
MLRDTIKAAQVSAMKAGDKQRLAAVRLILAKLKMAKQRRESIAMFEQGGRQELAEVEKGELAVIEEFMPAQMSEDDTKAAIAAIIAEVGAEGMKDMGKVVGALKAKHGSQLDMGKASGLVKAALG